MTAVRLRSPIALCLSLLLPMAVSLPASARTFQVLHTFHGPDGAAPSGTPILDSAGNIYDITGVGGSGTHCTGYGFGCGTAFVLNKAGKEMALYSFNGPNGASPQAGLLRDLQGNFYGTTENGGIYNDQVCPFGCGVAFRLGQTGKEIFYQFKGTPDGFYPGAIPVEDSKGNLYGTTALGGPPPGGLGTVFKIDSRGRETILYSFTGSSDGCSPGGGVVLDSAGNLYGTANQGGADFCEYGFGTIFKIDTTGHFSVIHTFDGRDGAYPGASMLLDSEGNIWGITAGGGSSGQCGFGGCGTVFELSPGGNGIWAERVVYNFCSEPNCTDGQQPSGGLAQDTSGNIYGTTFYGGTYLNCNGDACGVVYKVTQDGGETVLHDFTGGSDGAFPVGGLAIDGSGSLYGVTEAGGATCDGTDTCGVVFKIVP